MRHGVYQELLVFDSKCKKIVLCTAEKSTSFSSALCSCDVKTLNIAEICQSGSLVLSAKVLAALSLSYLPPSRESGARTHSRTIVVAESTYEYHDVCQASLVIFYM